MAIIKQARNINIRVKNNSVIMARKITETAEIIIVDATKENLILNSNKKIIANGNRS